MRRAGLIERRVPASYGRVPLIGGGGGGSAPAPPFVPTDIVGLTAWFDMQDATAYAESGGVLDSVKNKVSASDWTAAGSARAAFAATGLNGHPCADHDGSNDVFDSTEAAVLALFTDTPARTLIYVAHHDATGANAAVFGTGRSDHATQSTGWFGQRSTSRWTSGLSDSAATAKNIDSTGASDTDNHVFVFRHNGTQESIRIDSNSFDPTYTSQDGTVTPNRMGIGMRVASTKTLPLNGQWGEILIWDTALSDTDLDTVVAYLNGKWL